MITTEQELASRLIEMDAAIVQAVRIVRTAMLAAAPGPQRDTLAQVCEHLRPLWFLHCELERRRTATGGIVTEAEEQALKQGLSAVPELEKERT